MAGLSVGLVLIPQALAYATLAGMPAERGLLVAVAATLAAAPFASSPFLQTGPVAVTALLTFGALQGMAPVASDSYVRLGMLLAIMVGLIRLAVGLAREGDVAYLLSRAVIAGFTPAAALVIAASQIPMALDVEVDGQVMVRAGRALAMLGDADPMAVIMTVASTVIIMSTARRWPRLPSVALVVLGGIAVTRFSDFGGAVVGTVPALDVGLQLDLPWGQAGVLFVPAVIIAIVGFGDVAAVARTYAAETRTRWDADREFVSQGAANLASGLVGGFPVGGSFSRSALGRLAGARTTWAGAVTGLVVLAFLPFVKVLADLPLAVLAGIIIASVARLLRAIELREIRRLSRPQFRIAVITGFLTIALSPRIQWALIVGVVLSVGWHLRRETMVAVDAWAEGGVLHLRPSGVLYFGSAHLLEAKFRELLAGQDDVHSLVVHADRLGRVDVSGAMEIRDLVAEADSVGITTTVTDLGPASQKILSRTLRQNLTKSDYTE